MPTTTGGYGQRYGGVSPAVGAAAVGNLLDQQSFQRNVQRKQLQLQARNLELAETQMFLNQQNTDRAALLQKAEGDRADWRFAETIALQKEQLRWSQERFDREEQQAVVQTQAKQWADAQKMMMDRAEAYRNEANKVAERQAQPGQAYQVTLPDGSQATIQKPMAYSPEEEMEMRDIRGSLGGMTSEVEAVIKERERVQKGLAENRIAGNVLDKYRQEALNREDEALAQRLEEAQKKRWEAEVRLGMTRTRGQGDEQLLAVILQAPGLPAAMEGLGSTPMTPSAREIYALALQAMQSRNPADRQAGVLAMLTMWQKLQNQRGKK